MKTAVFTIQGLQKGEYELPSELFEVSPNPYLIHQVYRYLVLSKLKPVAHTKDRAEVRGGGKKPWKQKGTGRARHGSTRSPIWRKGGVTFGPTKDKNFAVSINKKMKRKALSMTLSSRLNENKFLLVDSFDIPQIKTKKGLEILQNLKLDKSKTLIIGSRRDEKIEKSIANLRQVSFIYADSLNIEEILKCDTLVASIPSIEVMKNLYIG